MERVYKDSRLSTTYTELTFAQESETSNHRKSTVIIGDDKNFFILTTGHVQSGTSELFFPLLKFNADFCPHTTMNF